MTRYATPARTTTASAATWKLTRACIQHLVKSNLRYPSVSTLKMTPNIASPPASHDFDAFDLDFQKPDRFQAFLTISDVNLPASKRLESECVKIASGTAPSGLSRRTWIGLNDLSTMMASGTPANSSARGQGPSLISRLPDRAVLDKNASEP